MSSSLDALFTVAVLLTVGLFLCSSDASDSLELEQVEETASVGIGKFFLLAWVSSHENLQRHTLHFAASYRASSRR